MVALVFGTLTACHDSPTDVSSPVAESLTDASPDLTPDIASARSEPKLVETETENEGVTVVAVIGRSGGTIRAGDHTLEVPRNAVGANTSFTMEVLAGSNIVVRLKARGVDSDDPVTTFRTELTLTLSYWNVYNSADLRHLKNVYLRGDSPDDLVPLSSTLNKSDKTISSPIEHFSLYGMAME